MLGRVKSFDISKHNFKGPCPRSGRGRDVFLRGLETTLNLPQILPLPSPPAIDRYLA